MTQEVEHIPSKHKTLSSDSSITKKQRQNKGKQSKTTKTLCIEAHTEVSVGGMIQCLGFTLCFSALSKKSGKIK
jgi:hypothetical protein